MRIGVHVSIAGGLLESLARAKRLSCNTMQIFSRSPRGGPAPARTDEELDDFDRARRAAGIDPLVIHAPYIINLASPDRRVFGFSMALYQEEYRRAARLGAQYLVTHVGSHRGTGEQAGIARVAEALNRTLADGESDVMILLENTAGSGQGLGYAFEQLAAMRAQVARKERVGFCLDTAHLFAAGFPIHTEEGLEETLAQADRTLGLEHVKLVHLNDSKSAFDSRVDRHWHIGTGQIGREAMRRIVTHRRLRDLPFILETPKKTPQDDPRNLRTVRGFGVTRKGHAHETSRTRSRPAAR
ncbi:MAG: deoxyribonuclease IV [Candidatus Omnitrophica bacterium]|nr:deoxyribonuclease IV [Candidatus Omnitrophota bacterium]